VCLVASAGAFERIQNGTATPPQASTPPAIAPDEPVAIESRKSPASVPKVTSRPANIRIDKTLVLINVTVTDPLNRFVTGLEKEHFRLYEDKIQQDITQFSSEDAPISIGLVFDTSGSMGSKLQKSR
jgi:Ca-activated chloride channel homolog